jgi:hypothetical protein
MDSVRPRTITQMLPPQYCAWEVPAQGAESDVGEHSNYIPHTHGCYSSSSSAVSAFET